MAGYAVTFSVVDNATKQIEAINRRMAAMRAPMERMSRQVQRFVDLSGLGKVAQGFEWIGRAAGSALRTLVEIVPVLGTITGAASIAGMFKLVSGFAGWANQLSRTADSLGLSTQQLQQFEDAARLAGGRVEDMDSALQSLFKAQTAAITGPGADKVVPWFNRLGIAWRDATGHARKLSDMMPEVLSKLAAIREPSERAAAATALLGDRGNDLVEAFRVSHQSFLQWFTDAGRYKELTDKQKDSLQSFVEAQGRLTTAFDHLGQQITATMAVHFTPLLVKLSEFVEKHTPAIIAAVDEISKEFADWLANVDWTKVEDGFETIKDALKFIYDHAELIAALFATKWAIGIVTSIGGVVTALGPLGLALAGIAATVGGIVLAGKEEKRLRDEAKAKLGDKYELVPGDPSIGLEDQYREKATGKLVGSDVVAKELGHTSGYVTPGELLTQPAPAPAAPAAPAPAAPAPVRPAPAAQRAPPVTLPGGATNASFAVPAPAIRPPAQPVAPAGPPPTQAQQEENLRRAMDEQGVTDPSMRAGIAAIASGEGGFKPRSESGYSRTSNDRIRAIFGSRVADLDEAQLTQLKSNDEQFFNKVYGGRLGNAADEGFKYRGRGDFQLTGKGNYERYGKMIGADLVNNPDLVNDPQISAKIAVAYMRDRYKGGGFEAMKRAVGNPVASTEAVKNANYQRYMASGEFNRPAAPAAPPVQPAQATAPPAPVPPPPQPPNGTVDVNITGKNLPPDSAVTARGSGAVNVPPPRVEHQELMSI